MTTFAVAMLKIFAFWHGTKIYFLFLGHQKLFRREIILGLANFKGANFMAGFYKTEISFKMGGLCNISVFYVQYNFTKNFYKKLLFSYLFNVIQYERLEIRVCRGRISSI